jgi:gliding motility-associated-like protein
VNVVIVLNSLMNKRKLLLILLLLCSVSLLYAQEFSNKGKEFWIAYPAHIDGTNSVMGLYITSDVNTTGTVKVGPTTTVNFTVTANQVTRVFLGNGTGVNASNTDVYLNMADGIKSNAATKINSENPIVVYAHIIRSARSGASLIIPTQVLGNEYIAPSIRSTSVSNPGPNSNGTAGGIGQITVIATQANTTIEITPTAAGGSRAAGTPFQVTLLDAGDVYQFQASSQTDLSGTKIRSIASGGSGGCKPIAVFSSSTWSTFDCNGASGGDNLYQQIFPTRSWGKQFVTAPFINRPADIYRIFVQKSTTSIQVTDNGVTTTLPSSSLVANGNYYQYTSSNPLVIQGSDAISVVQYISSQSCKTGCTTGNNIPTSCYADPEMVILNPVEQTLSDITFFSAHQNFVPPSQTQVQLHYVNLIISKNFKNSVKIDNVAATGFIDIPGTNYSYLQQDLSASSATNPVHRVTADTGFSAIVYGYGSVESYGYNGGTNLRDFSRQATFNNPYKRIDSAITCVDTDFQFAIPLSFQPTSLRWEFTSAPNITPNTIITPTGSPVADSTPVVNGQTLYYFSPGKTFRFTAFNTLAVRDTVKLYTTSATPDGCGSTEQIYSIPITVYPKHTTDFFIAASGCVGEAVKLSPSTGSGIQYFWDTGDGKTFSFNQNNEIFNYSYTQAGNFSVKLRAVNSVGCISDEVSKTISITSKPIANFTFSSIRCIDTDITFTDASTSQVGSITKWTWNLDDGKGDIVATTNAQQTTKYTSTGGKTVSLQVETSSGCKSDVFIPATLPFVHPLPQPGFILPEVCLNDASAQFTDTSKISDGSEAQFTYLWNFNAGSPAVSPAPNITTSTLKNPQVKYNKSDNYTVSLRVTSKDGCVNTISQNFTVNGSIPKADFEVQLNNVLCAKTPVVILNKSTVDFGSVTKSEIYWDRVNNPTTFQTDESPAFNKAYNNKYTVSNTAGQNFNIRLVSYSGGNTCVSEVTKTITVHPNPLAAFTVSSAEVCFDEPVSFIDQTSNRSAVLPTRWVWDLGKGNTSSIQNPVRAYKDSGSFNTTLHVYSAVGCGSDTAMIALTVYPLPVLEMGTKSLTILEGGQIKLNPLFVYGNDLIFLWTPASYLSSDTAYSPVSKPADDIRYTFTVTGEGGCSVSDTIFIKVLKSPEIPNAFSPNGDGVNDTWNIKYLESYPGATVDVFNRYGQVVFRSFGYNRPWDGTSNGQLLPIGTYYYIINPKNGKPMYTGSITIIR